MESLLPGDNEQLGAVIVMPLPMEDKSPGFFFAEAPLALNVPGCLQVLLRLYVRIIPRQPVAIKGIARVGGCAFNTFHAAVILQRKMAVHRIGHVEIRELGPTLVFFCHTIELIGVCSQCYGFTNKDNLVFELSQLLSLKPRSIIGLRAEVVAQRLCRAVSSRAIEV